MPRKNRPTICRECGLPPHDGIPLSWNGLHIECGIARMRANNLQISAHRGPYFERQRQRTLAAWGGVPVENVQ